MIVAAAATVSRTGRCAIDLPAQSRFDRLLNHSMRPRVSLNPQLIKQGNGASSHTARDDHISSLRVHELRDLTGLMVCIMGVSDNLDLLDRTILNIDQREVRAPSEMGRDSPLPTIIIHRRNCYSHRSTSAIMKRSLSIQLTLKTTSRLANAAAGEDP
jgi:hypothetical protein